MNDKHMEILNDIYRQSLVYTNGTINGRFFLLSDDFVRNNSSFWNRVMEANINAVNDNPDYDYPDIYNLNKKYGSQVVKAITAPLMKGKWNKHYKANIRIDKLPNNKEVLSVAYSAKGSFVVFMYGVYDKKRGIFTLDYTLYSTKFVKYARDIIGAIGKETWNY